MENQEEYHLSILKFRRKYGNLDAEAFAEAFKTPFLVFELTGSVKPPKHFQAYSEMPAAHVATAPKVQKPGDTSGIYVAEVVKSARNSVKDNIFIGRKPWNDIVIPHANISKMHAYLRIDPKDGSYSIFDVASRMGTYIDEARLVPNRGHRIESKKVILFAGAVSARFLNPVDFFEYMEMFVKAGGA